MTTYARHDAGPLYTPRNIVRTAVNRVRLAERYYVGAKLVDGKRKGGTTVTRRTLKHHLDALAELTDYTQNGRRAGWTRCSQLTIAKRTGGYVEPRHDENGNPIREDGEPFNAEDYKADEKRQANATRIVRRVLDVLMGLGLVIVDRDGRLNFYRIDLEACEAIRMTDEPVDWQNDVPSVVLRIQDAESITAEPRPEPEPEPERTRAVSEWDHLAGELVTLGVSAVRSTIDNAKAAGLTAATVRASIDAYKSVPWCDPRHLVVRIRNAINGQDQTAASLWPKRPPGYAPVGRGPMGDEAEELRQQDERERDERFAKLAAEYGPTVDAMNHGDRLRLLATINRRLATNQKQRGRELTPASRAALISYLANRDRERPVVVHEAAG